MVLPAISTHPRFSSHVCHVRSHADGIKVATVPHTAFKNAHQISPNT